MTTSTTKMTPDFGINYEDSFATFSIYLANAFRANQNTLTVSSRDQQQTVKKLEQWIDVHRDFLICPLAYDKPREEDRRTISQDSIVIHDRQLKLHAPLIDISIQLSNELNLNELLVVKLLYVTLQDMKGRGMNITPEELKKRCVSLYQQERYDWCLSLLQLLQGSMDLSINEKFRQWITDQITSIVSPQFMTNVTKQLKDLSAVVSSSSHHLLEVSLLSQILLYSVDAIKIVSFETIVAIWDLLEHLMNQYQTNTSSDMTAPVRQIRLRVIYTIATSIRFAINITHSENRSHILNQSNFQQEFLSRLSTLQTAGNSSSVHRNVYSLLSLLWTINRFDGSGKPLFEQSMAYQNIFATIQDEILPNLTVSHKIDSMRPSYMAVNRVVHQFIFDTFSSMILDLIVNCSNILREHFQKEVDEFMGASETNEQKVEIAPHLVSLFSLIAYLAKHSKFADALRPEGGMATVSTFLESTCPIIIMNFNEYKSVPLVHYLQLLHVLCTTTENGYDILLAPLLEQQKEDGTYLITWDIFERTIVTFEEDDAVIYSTLTLVEGLVKESSYISFDKNNVVNSLIEIASGVNHIPREMSREETKLIGRVFELLGSFCQRFPEYIQHTWTCLENIWATGCVFHSWEMKTKSYDITLGILNLLEKLLSLDDYRYLIHHLGQGYRTPGFIPYLNYVKDVIFAKHYYLPYQDVAKNQKWLLAQSSLKIMHIILRDYDPKSQPLTQQILTPSGNTIVVPFTHPGYELCCELLSERSMNANSILSLIVSTIEQGITITQEEERTEMILNDQKRQMADVDFSTINTIEHCLVDALGILKYGLKKQQAFVDLISKSVPQTTMNSQEYITVTSLDKYLILQPNIAVFLTKFLDYAYNVEIRLVAADMLLCLSNTQPEKLTIHLYDSQDVMDIFINCLAGLHDEQCNQLDYKIRGKIIKLLRENTASPSPALSHWLCGLNDQTVEKDTPDENCLSVICEMIKQSLGADMWIPHQLHDKFIEQCLELIKHLCHDRRVYTLTFKVLEHYGLFTSPSTILVLKDKYLDNLSQYASEIEASYHHLIAQQGLILDIIAFKLFVQSQNSEESKTQMKSSQGAANQLINILFNSDPVVHAESRSNIWLDKLLIDGQEQRRATILELLDGILKTLVDKPLGESHRLERSKSMCRSLKGWQSILEVFLSKGMTDLVFTGSDNEETQFREQLLINVSTAVLVKLSAILALTTNQSEEYLLIQHTLTQITSRLMSKLKEQQTQQKTVTDNETASVGPYRSSLIDRCTTILQHIIQCLLRNYNCTLTTRGNLYATLLDYLHYSRLRFATMHEQQQIMDKENEQILSQTHIDLISRIGRDILDCGDNAWKGVALATLDSLFSKSSESNHHSIQLQWIEFISSSGLLRQLIDELCLFQPQLMSLLVVDSNFGTTNEQERINKLYIHESIMSLLLKISLVDPNVLTKYNILGMITAQFKFLDIETPQVEYSEHSMIDEDHYDLADLNNKLLTERYHQLCVPTLKLVVSIILQMHSNYAYIEQGLLFVEKHYKMLKHVMTRAIVDSGDNQFSPFILEQASLVTSLLYLLGGEGHHNRRVILKSERVMLQLLSKYSGLENAWRIDSKMPHELIREICRNILAYFRLVTQHLQSDYIALRAVVSPSVSDSCSIGSLLSVIEQAVRYSFELTKTIQETYEHSSHNDQIILGYAIGRAALGTIIATRLAPYQYIVENAVLLLLRHLSFFLSSIPSVPADQQTKLRADMTNRVNLLVQNLNKLDMYRSEPLRTLMLQTQTLLKQQPSLKFNESTNSQPRLFRKSLKKKPKNTKPAKTPIYKS